jgi:hypothetical protein
VEARVAELVATRRPEHERLVRDAVDAELAALVDRQLNAVTERLAARNGSTPAGAEALPMANPAGSSRPSLGLEVVSRSEARRRSTLLCSADNSCACRRRSHSGSGRGRDLEQEIRLEELQLLDRPTRRLDVKSRLDPLAGRPALPEHAGGRYLRRH